MHVLVEDRPPVRHLVLNRPQKRNAFDEPLVHALDAALAAAAVDPAVEVVVLRGAGPVFSAGIDVDTLRLLVEPSGLRRVRDAFVTCWNRCETMDKTTVAVVHGHAVGAAFELTLACDLRVIADDATLGLPETRIGAVPDVGGLARLSSLVGLSRAKELVLTGAMFDGRRAQALGLANRCGPPEDLEALTDALVADLLACSVTANGLAKRILDAAAKPALHATLAAELDAQLALHTGARLRGGIDALAARLE